MWSLPITGLLHLFRDHSSLTLDTYLDRSPAAFSSRSMSITFSSTESTNSIRFVFRSPSLTPGKTRLSTAMVARL